MVNKSIKNIKNLLFDDGYKIIIENNILLITKRDFSFACSVEQGLERAYQRVYHSIYILKGYK